LPFWLLPSAQLAKQIRLLGPRSNRICPGKKVRLYDPSLGSETIVEILHPDAIQGISVAEVAKRAGVSQDSVISVLSGAAEKLRVNQKTAGKIRDVAAKLGYRAEETGVIHLASNDIGTAMDGVEVVIYIPESESARGDVKTAHRHALETGKKLAKAAKAGGVKRFVFAAEYPLLHEEDNKVETELKDVSDQEFAVTILRLGELYGHAKSGHWFGDLHDESGRLKDHPTVNILTARAILNGKVSVTDTEPKPFLHVEDAATSITAILDAPSQVVGGQIYDIGSDDQICTLGEIVRLIRQQAPSTDYIVAEGVGSGASTNLILTKIFDELGFAPAETLEEGIAQLVAALKDGTVSNYLSVQTGKVGGAAKTQNANDEAPEIQWESLTMTSIEIEIPGTSTDQSIQKH